jgi:hypothetical protein
MKLKYWIVLGYVLTLIGMCIVGVAPVSFAQFILGLLFTMTGGGIIGACLGRMD